MSRPLTPRGPIPYFDDFRSQVAPAEKDEPLEPPSDDVNYLSTLTETFSDQKRVWQFDGCDWQLMECHTIEPPAATGICYTCP